MSQWVQGNADLKSIRIGQAWPQRQSLLGRWESHADWEPICHASVPASQAATWTWQAGKARQLPQAAWAPWEQTRPSAGSPAWCSITLHY